VDGESRKEESGLNMRRYRAAPAWVLLAVLLLAGCAEREEARASVPAAEDEASPAVKARPAPPAPKAEAAEAPRINAQRAMGYVREVVAFGRRSPGSEGHRNLQQYLREKLKGDDLEVDSFTAQTPFGPVQMANFIVRFPGTKDGVIVLGGHYDTPHFMPDEFVGANDGGSSTGLLLELAEQLRGRKRDGYEIWLVWFDGEEAMEHWSEQDSLYGSRHLAARWEKEGTLARIKAFLLADMVGDADLHIDRDLNSTPWLLDLVYEAARRRGYQSYFFRRTIAIEDDHLPFVRRGVPAANLIDFEYGYGNVFHHTPQDTLDKLSPRSLGIVGDVILQTVWKLDARDLH
jgi:glutaminyl-peptide cyclotransferase